jgi:lipase chaperone LimK
MDTLRRAAAAPGKLRRDAFDEQGAAALSAVAREQRRIVVDPTLGDDERFMQFAALEAQLPDSVRAARAAATIPPRLAEDEAALRAAGGSAEDIQALRARIVGSDAAERLAALDQQRAEWQGRVDVYRQERAAIAQDPSLAPDQRDTAIEALRARDFSGSELLRIRALDGMQQTAAPPQQ